MSKSMTSVAPPVPAIYSMFCTGEVWNPADLFKIDMPEHLKEQQLAKAIKQATRFLEKQGLSVA